MYLGHVVCEFLLVLGAVESVHGLHDELVGKYVDNFHVDSVSADVEALVAVVVVGRRPEMIEK